MNARKHNLGPLTPAITVHTVKLWREGAKVCLRHNGREFVADMEIEPAAIAEYERIASLGNAALKREWCAWTRCEG